MSNFLKVRQLIKMEIKEYLKKLRIKFKVFKHPEVYTCEEAEQYSKDIKGIHSKNLFVKNKKSKAFYLVIIPVSTSITNSSE